MNRLAICFLAAFTAFSPLTASAQGLGDFFDGFFGTPRSRQEAQDVRRKALEFDYNVHLEWFFVNNEYAASDNRFAPSRTMCGVRATPSVGLRINQERMTHRLLGGIDILKDFGASPTAYGAEADRRQENWNLFREITLYYNLSAVFGRTEFSAVAGIFPGILRKGPIRRPSCRNRSVSTTTTWKVFSRNSGGPFPTMRSASTGRGNTGWTVARTSTSSLTATSI